MNIAILTGGETKERAIALRSAQNVYDILNTLIHVEIFDFPKDLNKFLSTFQLFDCAIPVFHGRGGEDGTVQGFLKTLNIPFLFSDVSAHAIAMNKDITKKLMKHVGIQTADWRIIKPKDQYYFKYPIVIKPICEGSSIGIAIVKDKQSMHEAIHNAFSISNEILLERYIEGREFSVAIIEKGGKMIALPVIEIKSKNMFFDHESKYDASLCEEICPAHIDDTLADQLQTMAIKAHREIGAQHISRTDMIVDKNNVIWFLEINTIPGMTHESLLPKALKAGNIDFEELLQEWILEVA